MIGGFMKIPFDFTLSLLDKVVYYHSWPSAHSKRQYVRLWLLVLTRFDGCCFEVIYPLACYDKVN